MGEMRSKMLTFVFGDRNHDAHGEDDDENFGPRLLLSYQADRLGNDHNDHQHKSEHHRRDQ